MDNLEYIYQRRGHSAFRTRDYVFHQLIPYIGNKRKLLRLIHEAVDKTRIAPATTFLDLFAGSGVVSRMAKKQGFRVISNDWEPYAQAINQCYIAANSAPAFDHFGGYENAVARLNSITPCSDWITQHLCPANDDEYDIHRDRLFYTRSNGMIIDAMRLQLQHWQDKGLLSPLEFSCLLAPMLYQACYTSNTSGVFKGFHNGWGGQTKTALYRILSQFQLKPALFHDNFQENTVYQLDALQLAKWLNANGETVDIAYLDPPYNQHPYGSNYHVLNTITLWDKPPLTEQIEGRNKSAIREDWRTERRSPYNHRQEAARAYAALMQTLNARYILTSYSTDGLIPLMALIETCIQRGQTDFVLQQYKRYRVSTQRFSEKPLNIELILIVDTGKSHRGQSAEAICDSIMHAEQSALNQRGNEA
ncbi:MAG: DNA adenine methylase [Janthinobacterium lividum]